jgi:hypothetical protein
MPQAVDTLPDDPGTLKAMLIAERVRSERLVQIIKELQRHRFGRRAETLPEDQLLLGLEEVEQTEAGAAAEAEAKSPPERAATVRKRRTNRGALPPHLPRIETIVDIEDKACRAARANSTGSARTSASSSTSCRRSSGCWSCAAPNMLAALARTSLFNRRRWRG